MVQWWGCRLRRLWMGLALVGLLVATLATLVGNLLADLSYAWIDPRVSLTERTA